MLKQARITERSFDYLLLIFITLLTFWPATFHVFSFKNDALVQYLPFRYHLSESIQHGHFPFWTPYLYTGFPIHADMQGMTWNPIVLVISFITRYNMTVLQTEMVIYLVLAAIGMYRLLDILGCNRPARIVGAISFAACGYITDSASVIPWVASAAFLPFVFASFIALTRKPDFIHSIGFGISLSFLFLCGYPSFFIFATYILIAGIIALLIKKTYRKTFLHQAWWKFFIISGVLFLLICSPAIWSYIDFLPYYSRGSGLSQERAATNPFPIAGIISYLAPQAPAKAHTFIQTDLSVRNAYVGLFILVFFISSLFSRKNYLQKFIITGILFFFIYSLGNVTPLHEWSFSYLPFMKTFRHPGTIRVYTSIGIIVLACFALHWFIESGYKRKQLVMISRVIGAALLILLIYCAQRLNTFPKMTGVKSFLDSITFHQFAFAEAIIQLFFLAAFFALLNRKSTWSIRHLLLLTVNIILFAQFALPLTFFSSLKTKQVDSFVKSFPDGYPVPGNNNQIRTGYYADSSAIHPEGYDLFYNKQIRYHDHLITPTVNKDYDRFSNRMDLRTFFDKHFLAYFATTLFKDSISANIQNAAVYENTRQLSSDTFSSGVVTIKSIAPNKIIFNSSLNGSNGMLVVFQQYNHNWKAYVNNDPRPVYRINIAFLAMPVYKGESLIELVYDPVEVKWCMLISAITVMALTVMLVIYFIRNQNAASHA